MSSSKANVFDKDTFDSVLLRRMLVVPSFEIYGGERGLYDFGPDGSLLLDNIVSVWKQHFVLRDNMFQISASCLTPEIVLKTSGHVDRFEDLMCKDVTTGNCFRADKLLENCIESKLEKEKGKLSDEEVLELEQIYRQADAYSPDELDELIKRFGIKAPDTGKDLSKPFPFNLMFATLIGPEGNHRGYLRPETAQGIFVNFKRLLEKSGGKLPFACAQIGLGFRNEISPRAGLLRVREFLMGEIEHFVDPENKSHERFDTVKDLTVSLFTKEDQLGDGNLIAIPIGEAVSKGIVGNETLGYYIGRTYLFLTKIGINPSRLRFRQHLNTQMAHYASDCWDGEIETSYGWIECVGIADRSCYDLMVHSKATKTDLVAHRSLPNPKTIKIAAAKVNKGVVGKTFKAAASNIITFLTDIQEKDVEMAMRIEGDLAGQGESAVLVNNTEYKLTRAMVSYALTEKIIHKETYFPHVIEPSFGLGRIFYSLLEHNFYTREVEANTNQLSRSVFKFSPLIAPIKVALFPLQTKAEFVQKTEELKQVVVEELSISADTDASSASIGKRYARMDEIGVPFALTIDQAALEGEGITLRDRDSMSQVRIPEDTLKEILFLLVHGKMDWTTVTQRFQVL